MDRIRLVPQPKQLHLHTSWGLIPKSFTVTDQDFLSDENELLQVISNGEWITTDDPFLIIEEDLTLPFEGYSIQTFASRIRLRYKDINGRRYGLDTLSQLIQTVDQSYPICEIEDWPSLPIRGYLVDISRNKIPKLSSLKTLVDQLAKCRINHLELYVEGRSLEIESFQSYFEEEPFTLEEYRHLEHYAKHKGIDLVGNLNTFGHMTDWLSLPDFAVLAECPEGFIQWGFPFPPSTLNPLNPNSQTFVQTLLNGFIPHTSSSLFHLNGDEPFELGRGHSKDMCETRWRGQVYARFMNPIIDFIHQHQKRPLIWADVVFEHQEMLEDLHDVLYVDWGYESHHPFEERASLLESKQKPFLLAPGTSSWNSLSGRLKNATINIQQAIRSALNHSSEGALLTDWGDFGHMQFPVASVIPLCTFALLSYQGEGTQEEIATLATQVFFESEPKYYSLWERLGSLYEFERLYVPNGTVLFRTFQFVDPDRSHPLAMRKAIWQREIQKVPLSIQSQSQIETEIQTLFHELESMMPVSEVSQLIKQETMQTLRLLEIALRGHQVVVNANPPIPLPDLLDKIEIAIREHHLCWLHRNKPSNLKKTLSRLQGLHTILASDL